MTDAEAFPPAPWHLAGECWVGLFQADAPLPCPAPWKPLLSARTAMVALMHYDTGTLRYDELMVGPLVRAGTHLGLLVSSIWVDSPTSVAGGRTLWQLPKQLARFAWEEGRVRIEDADGPIATLSVQRNPARLPRLPLPMPGIGGGPGNWCHFTGRLRGRLSRGGLGVEQWSPRFPFRLAGPASFSVRASGMQLTVPAPHPLHFEES